MSVWPGENGWEASKGGSRGSDTRAVRDPLASHPRGVQLVPGVDKGLCRTLVIFLGVEEDIKTSESFKRLFRVIFSLNRPTGLILSLS